jgi:hypothetical protein
VPAKTWVEKRKRRGAAVRTVARRRDLADISRAKACANAAFLRSLYRQDPDLEVFWHPVLNFWVLYRVVRRGVVPADDLLLKELPVCGPRGEYRPLGQWLLDWLRENDLTRSGSLDPGWARRRYIEKLMRDEKDDKREASEREVSMRFARDCERYCLSDPYSRDITLPDGFESPSKGKQK